MEQATIIHTVSFFQDYHVMWVGPLKLVMGCLENGGCGLGGSRFIAYVNHYNMLSYECHMTWYMIIIKSYIIL